MNLRHPIELLISDEIKKIVLRDQSIIDFSAAEVKAKDQDQHLIVQYRKTGRYYMVNPFDDLDKLGGNVDDYIFYDCPKIFDYLDKKSITPIIDQSPQDAMIMYNANLIGQLVNDAAASKINVDSNYGLRDILKNPNNVWNITSQIAFPIVFGLAAGMVRCISTVQTFEKVHGRPMNDEEKRAIYKDCAAYTAKNLIYAGAGELGIFIGQCVISICSVTPYTAWIPAVLAIGSGLFQGIFAVVNQIADEKQRFGKVRSSKLGLATTFFNSFINGAVGTLMSFVPFAPLIAVHILKPLAQIIGDVLCVTATYISKKIVNYFVPKTTEKLHYLWGEINDFFKKKEPPEVELKPLDMKKTASGSHK